MDLYSGLFDSMVSCCGRIGLRHGPVYTIAMMALAAGVSLNMLSIVDLLSSLGLLDNPYRSDEGLHPQHYLSALLCAAFIASTVLARLKLRADPSSRPIAKYPVSTAAAPTYLLGSAGIFLFTLTIQSWPP